MRQHRDERHVARSLQRFPVVVTKRFKPRCRRSKRHHCKYHKSYRRERKRAYVCQCYSSVFSEHNENGQQHVQRNQPVAVKPEAFSVRHFAFYKRKKPRKRAENERSGYEKCAAESCDSIDKRKAYRERPVNEIIPREKQDD